MPLLLITLAIFDSFVFHDRQKVCNSINIALFTAQRLLKRAAPVLGKSEINCGFVDAVSRFHCRAAVMLGIVLVELSLIPRPLTDGSLICNNQRTLTTKELSSTMLGNYRICNQTVMHVCTDAGAT